MRPLATKLVMQPVTIPKPQPANHNNNNISA
jgi:hypothetical protein